MAMVILVLHELTTLAFIPSSIFLLLLNQAQPAFWLHSLSYPIDPKNWCQINFSKNTSHMLCSFSKICNHSTFSAELCYISLPGIQGTQQYVPHPTLKLSVHSPKPSAPSTLVYTLLPHNAYISLLSRLSSHHFPCLQCILPRTKRI